MKYFTILLIYTKNVRKSEYLTPTGSNVLASVWYIFPTEKRKPLEIQFFSLLWKINLVLSDCIQANFQPPSAHSVAAPPSPGPPPPSPTSRAMSAFRMTATSLTSLRSRGRGSGPWCRWGRYSQGLSRVRGLGLGFAGADWLCLTQQFLFHKYQLFWLWQLIIGSIKC